MLPAKKKTQLRLVVRTRRLPSVTCLLWLSLLCCSKFKRRKAMDSISVSLTVFFDGQFYVGLVERTQNDMLTCCRIVFGAEPKDCEIYRYLLDSWYSLAFSPPVSAGRISTAHINPKRMQRTAARLLSRSAEGGTKSQQALRLQREQNKVERRIKSKAQKQAAQQAAFLLRQQKKKEKHRGH